MHILCVFTLASAEDAVSGLAPAIKHLRAEEPVLAFVERAREVEAPAAVIASYGFCHTTIHK